MPMQRICIDCFTSFTTNWSQSLCSSCKELHRTSLPGCEQCGQHTRGKLCRACYQGPVPSLRAMTACDLAWMAGLIEGEGSLIPGGRRYGSVRVAMTDLDILQRLAEVFGVGTICSLRSREAHHKQAWVWQVVRQANVADLTEVIAPFLLERRRAATARLLALHERPIPPPQVLHPGSPAAWAWTAGLLEGEAYFRPSPTAKYPWASIEVRSIDKDSMLRLTSATGAGTVRPRRPQQDNWRSAWFWSVGGSGRVVSILTEILPLLGERRSGQAQFVIDRWGRSSLCGGSGI
jgi:hypothetical protein